MNKPLRQNMAGPNCPPTLAQLTANHTGGWKHAVFGLVPVLAVVVLAFVLQLVLVPMLGAYHGQILIYAGIAVIMAVSLNIVNGFCGQFSLGHAGFMALGGYVAAAVVYYGSIKLWGSPALRVGDGEGLFVAAALIGGLAAAVLGYVVGLPSLRLRGDYLAIVTLGFGEIVRVIIEQTKPIVTDFEAVRAQSMLSLIGKLNGSMGFAPVPPAPKYTTVFWTFVFVGLTVLVAHRLKTASRGRALLAIRENEIAAESMGVDTVRSKVLAFVVAAFFAGIAGSL